MTVRRPRVLIEAEKLERPFVQGTQRYVRGLLQALLLPDLACGWDLSILRGGRVLPLSPETLASGTDAREGGPAHRRAPRLGRALLPAEGRLATIRRRIGRRRISRLARRRWAARPPFDLAHLTSPHSSRSLDGYDGPLVGTVLDTTHRSRPQHHLEETIESTHRGLARLAERACGVVAISRHSGEDFVWQYGFPAERLRVVPLGVDHSRFRPSEDRAAEDRLRARYALERPFLLILGTVEPRKNVDGMIRAWLRLKAARPDLVAELVVAGRSGWKTREAWEWIERGRAAGVRRLGYVDDDELPVLYRAALGLCYVSHYEGFGLPLLEAMSCGTPVVYGDNSAMRELVGAAGLAADSESLPEIESAMLELVGNQALRERLSRRSIERAARYSWERTARETLEAYTAFLAAAPGSTSRRPPAAR